MAREATVLVVENDEAMQRLLQQTLRPRYTVLTASCWTQAHEIRSRAEVDVVIVDVNHLAAADHSGLDALRLEADSTPLVLLASPTHDSPGRHHMHAPALLTFPARPVALRELHRSLEEAVVNRRDGRDVHRPACHDELNGILAESNAMRTVMDLIGRAAQCDTPVLLIGESGTGKELLARALHRKSPRAPGPFVVCSRRRSAGRSSSTKSATWRRRSRASCCASCRRRKCIPSAPRLRSRRMCGS
jgi:DNA-binding NtrC family response regulator